MGVSVESDRCILMPHDICNGFDVHSAVNGASGECMPESMKVEFARSCAFGEFFEYVLIRTN